MDYTMVFPIEDGLGIQQVGHGKTSLDLITFQIARIDIPRWFHEWLGVNRFLTGGLLTARGEVADFRIGIVVLVFIDLPGRIGGH